MKQTFFSDMRNRFEILGKLLLLVMAAVMGGGAMAVEIGENGSDTDPNAGLPLEGATPDDPNKGIDQQGNAATGSAVTQAGLGENKVEDYVSKFESYKYPMHTDFMRIAKQIKVDTKEPSHFTIGETVMDCETKSETANTEKENSVVLSLYANDMKLFPECGTILVDGIIGYDEAGNQDGSPLVLYVESADKTTGVRVVALNGPLNNGETYVPTIPAGTTLHVMAPAMSESEIEIAPDALLPKEETAFLQKKVCPITWTEFFERINKKANWNVKDLKNALLRAFRKKCTRSMLIGVGRKFTKTNKKTGTEYVYTQKGVLRQLRLGYQIGNELQVGDLIGITRMLGGKYATTKKSEAYCGTLFMEKLLNIDFTKHREIVVKRSESEDVKIGLVTFETPFHTLEFKVEHALDDLGYQECCVIFPMSDAKRYIYQDGKFINVDHEKGEGGEVREAKSQYYVQDDCLMLTGYNSMLVGPDVTISGYNLSALENTIVSVDAMSKATDTTKLVYLTTADGEYGVGLYEHDGSAWVPYSGEINA